jgi:hypothetical protein
MSNGRVPAGLNPCGVLVDEGGERDESVVQAAK